MKKQLLKESGIRDINNIAKRYKKAKIYFHIDLDGVTTAIGMKKYLERYGIKVVDAETIQYGDDEWAIKKPEASGNVMPVLVDFAHGKPMFIIHTDHHDTQSGVEKETSTSFRHARSNVETMSGIISPQELFPASDIKLISTVDSANFLPYGLTTKDVRNYIFNYDRSKSVAENSMIQGLVTNKILLAFKSKDFFGEQETRNILEKLVLISEPSLKNIYNNLIKLILDYGLMKKLDIVIENIVNEIGDGGNRKNIEIRALQQQLQKHGEEYVKQIRQKEGKVTKYEDGIIIKDGGGSMKDTGSYDRYVAFEIYPDADFQVVTWAVGLLQVSCNPFKQSRGLKGVDLGEINKSIIEKYKPDWSTIKITAGKLKKTAERSKKFVPFESVGFTLKDMMAFYGKSVVGFNEIPKKFENFMQKKYPKNTLGAWKKMVIGIMDKPYVALTEFEQAVLDSVYTTAYDVIKNNSGGHKCITNFQISALGGGFGEYKSTELLKKIRDEFVQILKDKINAEKSGDVNETYFRRIIKRVMKG
jgi:hypothetical protein